MNRTLGLIAVASVLALSLTGCATSSGKDDAVTNVSGVELRQHIGDLVDEATAGVPGPWTLSRPEDAASPVAWSSADPAFSMAPCDDSGTASRYEATVWGPAQADPEKLTERVRADWEGKGYDVQTILLGKGEERLSQISADKKDGSRLAFAASTARTQVQVSTVCSSADDLTTVLQEQPDR